MAITVVSAAIAASVLLGLAGRLVPKAICKAPGRDISAIRRACAMIVFLTGFDALDHQSMAGPVLQSASVNVIFTPDSSDPNTTYTASGDGVNGVTLDQTVTKGGGSSTGYAQVYTVTSDTVAGFSIAAGTGIYRDDPSDAFQGATTLEIQVSGTWKIEGSTWGPTVYNYANFPILSVNVNAGDIGTFELTASYGPGNSSYSVDHTFNQTGASLQYFDYLVPHSPTSLSVGSLVEVSGDIIFSFEGHSEGGMSLPEVGGLSAPEPSSLVLAGIGGLVLLVSCGSRHRWPREHRCVRQAGQGASSPAG
jgi:hypothetical protein